MLQLFITSLLYSLLHSLWQLPLLFLVYKIFSSHKNQPALQVRNQLYYLLLLQLIVSVATTCFYFFGKQIPGSGMVSFWSHQQQMVITNTVFTFYIFALTAKLLWLHLNKKSGLSSLEQTITVLDTGIEEQVRRIKEILGIRRDVLVKGSSSIISPMVYGWLKPIILFPIGLINNISPEETEALLRHEFYHIKHNDYLLNSFLLVAESLYFFNPVIYLLTREIKEKREMACDEAVIADGISTLAYAGALYKIASPALLAQPVFALAAAGNKHLLLRRLQKLQEGNITKRGGSRPLLALAFIFIATLAITFYLPGRINNNSIADRPIAANKLVTKSAAITNKIPSSIEYATIIKSTFKVEAGKVMVDKKSTLSLAKNLKIAHNESIPVLKDLDFAIDEQPQATTVSFVEGENTGGKIVYIQEENSNGKKQLTAIRISMRGDQVIAIPLWQVQQRIVADSTKPVADSLQ